ncbi:hypothetical protein V8E55_002601 [Tylopilus felleus]
MRSMPGILIVFKDGCYGSTFGVIDAIMVSKGRFRVVIFDDEAFLSDAGKSFSVTGKIRSMYLLDEKSIMLHEESLKLTVTASAWRTRQMDMSKEFWYLWGKARCTRSFYQCYIIEVRKSFDNRHFLRRNIWETIHQDPLPIPRIVIKLMEFPVTRIKLLYMNLYNAIEQNNLPTFSAEPQAVSPSYQMVTGGMTPISPFWLGLNAP